MTAADYLMLISMVCIWALMAINVFLSVGGFLYYHQCSKTDGHVPIDEYPFVSIMVPAHNESVVIRRTVRALLNFDYPHDRYEIIVINDNSTDDTANVLKQIQAANPGRNLIVVNTDNVVGGKGKSNALNIGYSVAKGSVFAIYDADNTPEPQALRILVESDERFVAGRGHRQIPHTQSKRFAAHALCQHRDAGAPVHESGGALVLLRAVHHSGHELRHAPPHH